MRHLSVAVVVAVAGLAACRSDSLQPKAPLLDAAISDGAHLDGSGNGNKDFFFLPPLVPNPVGTPYYDPGKFNAHLSPVVEVCELTAVDVASLATATCKSPTVRAFGPARMTLDASNEQYQLNWDTRATLLNAASFYRIIVRGASQGTILGSLDVDPVLGGMKNAKTGDVVVFQDGRTLPIKVRIEQGAFGSSNSNDRVEQVVPGVLPATGLDITTNTGFAGAHFSNGWLPAGFDQVVVIIERISPNCLNTPLEQLEGCYRFRTDPDLHGLGPDGTDLLFAVPAVAGVCFQFPGDIGQHNEHPFELMRSEELGRIVTPAQPLLDEKPAPFLHCDRFSGTPPSIGAAIRSGRIGDIARAGLFAVTHAIGRVLEPKALHAVDFGAGGSTNEFSRFGYAREATMTVTPERPASAPAGSTVPASVRLQNVHHGEASDIVGQAVTFSVTSGGGTLSASEDDETVCNEVEVCTVHSNSDGFANVSWRLGLGANTVEVTTSEVREDTQEMAATGTPTIFQATFSGDQLGVAPQTPDIGSWELVGPTDGTVLVRSAVGDLADQPVEIANAGLVAGTPVLHGLAAGVPPTIGLWTVRWRSVISSASEAGWSTAVTVGSAGLPTYPIATIAYLPGGQLNYGNSFSRDNQVATWAVGKSQLFELTIDLDNKIVRSLTIDGESVITDQPFEDAGATNVGRIRIGGGGTEPNTLGWDDVTISGVAPIVIGMVSGKRDAPHL